MRRETRRFMFTILLSWDWRPELITVREDNPALKRIGSRRPALRPYSATRQLLKDLSVRLLSQVAHLTPELSRAA